MTPKTNPFYNSTYQCNERPYGWESGQTPIKIKKPTALPRGLYLICGDRAWQGIPHSAYGGPCYLGSLTLLTPDINFLRSVSTLHRQKRSIETLGPDCKDKVELWSLTARFFGASIPPLGTVEALTEIQKLARWTAKQANVTTMVISQMAQDMDSLRRAVLQN